MEGAGLFLFLFLSTSFFLFRIFLGRVVFLKEFDVICWLFGVWGLMWISVGMVIENGRFLGGVEGVVRLKIEGREEEKKKRIEKRE